MLTYSRLFLESPSPSLGDFELVVFCDSVGETAKTHDVDVDVLTRLSVNVLTRLSFKSPWSTSDVLSIYRNLELKCPDMTFDLSGLEDANEQEKLKRSAEQDHETTYYFVAKNKTLVEKFKTRREYRRVKDRGWTDESYKKVATFVTISL